MKYIDIQLGFGDRSPGTTGHQATQDWIRTSVTSLGWIAGLQQGEMAGHRISNLIAFKKEEPPVIIIGAHYDTRMHADQDPNPENRLSPVPGANDGASGVAILLELARTIPDHTVPVWLVFFDAEDNGRIQGWDWILGSRLFVSRLTQKPEAVVILDMVGDAELQVYFEKNSDKVLRNEIWNIAEELGYGSYIIKQEKHSMLDDHTPFLEAGIPAVDIIDFDYPYWHTLEDTVGKVSPDSLQVVGETVLTWISRYK